jgi:hypothetical protein
VTLSGRFSLGGKVGPYILRNGEAVYLVPHGSFSWSSEYEPMEGKAVSITGTLHFQHFDQVQTGVLVDQPADYFYFDAETAKVRLK